MGQLDMIKGYEPVNITPQGAFNNSLTYYAQLPSKTYSVPEQFMGNGWQMGPFTPAGVSEVTHTEFLQDKWHWQSANTQIVSVPERPVDKGTFDAILAGAHGIYLQDRVSGVVHQYSGSAPTTGIYTGNYTANGEFESC